MGEKLTYIIATSRGRCDRRHHKVYGQVSDLRRNLFSETWLTKMLSVMDLEQRINSALREDSSLDRWDALTVRRESEQTVLMARRHPSRSRRLLPRRSRTTHHSSSRPRTDAEKRGRVSGSAAWRAQRGELGHGEAKRLSMVAEEEEVRDTAAGSSSSSSVESQLKARVQELASLLGLWHERKCGRSEGAVRCQSRTGREKQDKVTTKKRKWKFIEL